MRPIPSKKHHWAVLVLLAVVAANTALTFVSPRASADQANMLAEVFKQQDPARYGHDEVFGPSDAGAPWRLRLPAWRALLGASVWLAGGADPVNALRLLGATCLTVYLLAMYLLLYRETRSTSVATLVAAMSTAIFSVRRPYWGMGPIFTVSPTTLYMAFVPLLVLALTRSVRRRRVVGVFFLAGLAGNIDFVFAVNLVLVMLIALVALDRSRPRVWAMAAAAAAAALVGAAPAVWHYYVTFRAAEGFLPRMPLSTLRPALHLAELSILYPGVLAQALRWLPVAAGLAVPAAIILSRGGRYRATHLPEWLWLLGASLLVALGLHGLMQLIGWRLGTAPPFIEFFDALRLAMLPLYALFAQAMIQLLRLTQRRDHRRGRGAGPVRGRAGRPRAPRHRPLGRRRPEHAARCDVPHAARADSRDPPLRPPGHARQPRRREALLLSRPQPPRRLGRSPRPAAGAAQAAGGPGREPRRHRRVRGPLLAGPRHPAGGHVRHHRGQPRPARRRPTHRDPPWRRRLGRALAAVSRRAAGAHHRTRLTRPAGEMLKLRSRPGR